MPKVRPGPGLSPGVRKPSALYLAPGLQSSVGPLLEMPLAVGNMVKLCEYVAEDATVASWPARGVGNALTVGGAGADPLLVDSPLLVSPARGVRTLGKQYSGNLPAPFGSDNVVVEAVLAHRTTGSNVLTLGYAGVDGLTLYGQSFGLSLMCWAGGVSRAWSYVSTGGSALGELVYFLGAVKWDTLGGVWMDVNGSIGGAGGGDPRLVPRPLTATALSTHTTAGAIAYLAMWKGSDLGLRAGFDEQHHRRLAALLGSRPARSRYSVLRPAVSGSTSAAHQPRRLPNGNGSTQLFLMSANTPRFEAGVDGNGTSYVGAVIEGAVINSCLQSSVIGTTWTGVNAALANGAETAPDGSATADTVTATAANGYARQTFASITAVQRCYSHYVKRNGASDVAGKLQLVRTSTGAVIAEVAFTAAANWSAVPPFVAGVCVLDDTEIRLVVNNNGQAVFVWGAQLEPGAYPSLRVETTTVAVTKPADSQYYPIAEAQSIGVGIGSMYLKFYSPARVAPLAAGINLCTLSDGTTNNRILPWINTDLTIRAATRKPGFAGDVVAPAINVCDGLIHELLMTWTLNRLRLCIDGVWLTDAVGPNTPVGLNRVNVGSDPTPANHAGPVRIIDVRLWPKVISWSGRRR